MRKYLASIFILVLFCSAGYCDTKTIELQSKGVAANREEAIRRALYDAVRQGRGVEVSSEDYKLGFDSATADIDRGLLGGRNIAFDKVSIRIGGTVYKTDIGGLVKTYKVLSEAKNAEGKYEVTLKVWVYDYESPEKINRDKLAIMPIRAPESFYRFGKLKVSPAELSSKLSQRLTTGLINTHKFALLDREYLREYAQERNMLLSDDASIEEKAKLGESLGADYLLVGTIENARMRLKEFDSSAIGHRMTDYDADFVFSYRIIVGPTRQVKLSDEASISLETEGVKKLVREWEPSNLDYKELVDNLVSKVAKEVVRNIVERIYPIRVADVLGDDTVIIDQGGKVVRQKELLDVYKEGSQIKDSDTGETLGQTQIVVATIKIVKVSPNFSYAKVVKGSLSDISKGNVCVRRNVGKEQLKGSKSKIKRTSEGGVKLPFD